MPKQVTAFRAEDGSLHDNECEAARVDLKLLIAASPLAENRPYADKVLEWLTDQSDEIIGKLTEFNRACPRTAQEEAPQIRGEGPVVSQDPEHAPYCQTHNGFDCDCGANNGD